MGLGRNVGVAWYNYISYMMYFTCYAPAYVVGAHGCKMGCVEQ